MESSHSSSSSLEDIDTGTGIIPTRQVPVFISYGQHTKKLMLPKTHGKAELVTRCTELFPELDEFFIQYKDKEYDDGWVDVGSDFTVAERMQLKVVDITGTKRPIPSSSSDDETKTGTTKLLKNINAIKEKLKSKTKKKTKSSSEPAMSRSTLRFQMGWLHFNEKRHEYIQVRSTKGGGSLTVTMPRTASYQDVLFKGITLFFPGGKCHVGNISQMDNHLADYRANFIVEEGWQLQNTYSSGNKMRLYLCTKVKTSPPTAAVAAAASAPDQQSVLNNHTAASALDPSASTSTSAAASALDPSASTSTSAAASALDPSASTSTSAAATALDPSASTSTSAAATALEPAASTSTSAATSAHDPSASTSTSAAASALDQSASNGTASVMPPQFVFSGTPTVSFKALESVIVCPVCMQRSRDAILKNCGHTFCAVCLYTILEEEGVDAKCPTCRHLFQEVTPMYL